MKQLSKIFKILIGIIFVLSSSLLSVQLIVKDYYTIPNIVITSIISALVSIYFYIKTYKENYKIIKNNKAFTIISIGLISIVMFQLYLTKGIECKEMFSDWKANIFRVRFFYISSISAIYMGIYLLNKIKNWIWDFYKMLDEWDKKAYIVASIISILVIIIAYNTNSNWYLQYDKVYSLDSGWCFENIIPESTYYDIRHPLINFFVFPVWAIVNTLINFIGQSNLSTVFLAIIVQIINTQILILSGLIIKLLTKKKIVFITYMLSFPTILYTMFFEKYQLCTFLVVLYVFTICNKKEKSSSSLICSAGVMPTSCVIGIAEFLTKDKIKYKVKKVLQIVLVTLITFVCLGRGHILKNGLSEIQKMQKGYSNKSYTVEEKFISTTKMIQNSLCALPSEKTEKNVYWWTDIEEKISVFAILIIVFMIIGCIANRKELFNKICVAWVTFSFILFIPLSWSTQESPLFSIYFSWAIIPLVINGLEWVSEKAKLNRKVIYTISLIAIALINISTMYDINTFMKGL